MQAENTWSAQQSNHHAEPRLAAPQAGILIDVAETTVSTEHEHLAGLPAPIPIPASNGAASESSRLYAAERAADAKDTADMRAAASRIWGLCLERIRPQITAQTMRTWFEPLEATALEGSEITLSAPSSFFCEWIGEHYQDILEQSLRDVLGAAARFRFNSLSEFESVNTKLEASTPIKKEEVRVKKEEVRVKNNGDDHSSPRQISTPSRMPATSSAHFATPTASLDSSGPAMHAWNTPAPAGPRMTDHASQANHLAPSGLQGNEKRPLIETNFNPRFTFDTFIRGESNKLAYAAALAVANNPGGTRYNPLIIYGNVGLGKTHLIQAIGHSALSKFPSAKVHYTSSDRYMVDFVDSIQNDRINEFQAFYRSVDVLIIDDVQFFAGKEKTQEIFFHTFNALRELGKQIILTCDRPPKELKDIDDRLLNRLQWGLTTDIGAPDLETRIAILRHKAIADGIELPGDVIEFIAANITANIRELEGCLISLLAMSSLEGREPTLELARDVLRKVARRSTPIISIEMIQRTVAKRLGVEEELLRHKTRKQEVVLARQMAMYLCKELTHHSLKSIGFHFGGRDHSTVIHAIQTVQEDMKLQPLLATRMDELRKQIEMMT